MKKTFLIVCTCLFSFLSFSQTEKNIIYQDKYGIQISEETFLQYDKVKNYIVKTENDNTITNKITPRLGFSQLNNNQLNIIHSKLKNLIGNEFNPKKNIAIHTFNKERKALKKAINNKQYWDYIKYTNTTNEKYQSFLVISKDSKEVKSNKRKVYIDNENFILNTFFSKSIFDINHIIIKPDGKLYTFYGNPDILMALDSLFL